MASLAQSRDLLPQILHECSHDLEAEVNSDTSVIVIVGLVPRLPVHQNLYFALYFPILWLCFGVFETPRVRVERTLIHRKGKNKLLGCL